MSNSARKLTGRPVVFGEVLFDQFEDGSAVLGGAPFNVAWHLSGLGLNPLFISRIGDDALGKKVSAAMADWGMDVDGIQRDGVNPTGTVQVRLKNGQPAFTIIPDQAYDHIDAQVAIDAVKRVDAALIYYGSLISRSGTSRHALLELLKNSALPAFVDINLRPPWWDHELIWQSLRGARWAKLNDEEVRLVSGENAADTASLIDLAKALRSRFGFQLLIVTLGAEGAYFITDDDTQMEKPLAVDSVVDTVGAGDAFSAVTIFGLIQGWPLSTIKQRAVAFAAAICQIRGATTDNQSLYQTFLEKWRN